MPYKHVIKVSDKVYYTLKELAKELNLESPNQVIKHMLKNYLNKEVD